MVKIRTFIAIEIPPDLEAALRELLAEMRRAGGDVKWVDPASVHITLKFLGEITRKDVDQVSRAVESATAGKDSFIMRTGEKGAFPNLKRPRVFWVGLQALQQAQLLALQQEIESELEPYGFPREARAFKPHLTIGRVRSPRDIDRVTAAFTRNEFPTIDLPVREVLIMKSELTRQGAVYSVQRAFQLQDSGGQEK